MSSERSRLLTLLHRLELRPTKGLGQHFLAEEAILRSIVAASTVGPDADVIEVGGGIANLSTLLALTGANVTSLEVDRKFADLHREIVAGEPDFNGGSLRFVYTDALQFDYGAASEESRARGRRFVIVGNIPYQITSPLIMTILDSRVSFDAMTFLMQREVARRLAAPPGGRENGSITIKVQFDCEVELLDEVPAEVFLPPPEVDSQVVRFRLRDKNPDRVDQSALRRDLFNLVDAAFSQRRKMLANAVSASWPTWSKQQVENALEEIGKSPASRAEQLGREDYLKLLEALL